MDEVALRISGPPGVVLDVAATKGMTVQKLREIVQSKTGIRHDAQRLFFGKLELKDPTQVIGALPFDNRPTSLDQAVNLSLAHTDFCTITGYMPKSSVGMPMIEERTATIAEAMQLCSNIPGSKGFIYSGGETGEAIRVKFFARFPCPWVRGAGIGTDTACFHMGTTDGIKPVVAAILESHGSVFQQAEWLRDDRAIMLAVAKQRGLCLRHANDELKADPEIALAAVAQAGDDAVPYVAKALWNNVDFVDNVTNIDVGMLRHASSQVRGEPDVVLRMVKRDGAALLHASKKLRADPAVVSAAVEQNVAAFEYADEKLRSDPGFVQSMMKLSPRALAYASERIRSDKEFILPLVRLDDGVLQFASDALRADRAFVMQIAETQGDAIRHAWHTLWQDANVILHAARQDNRAMRHAGRQAWGNRDFVLIMVQNNWRDLRHATEDVRSDREIARTAIKMSPEALQFVSDSLKEDPEIVYLAYQQDEEVAVRYAKSVVFTERDFALAAAGVKVPPEWVIA